MVNKKSLWDIFVKRFSIKEFNRRFVFCSLFLFFFFLSLSTSFGTPSSRTLSLNINRAARSSRVSKLFCRQIFLNSSVSVGVSPLPSSSSVVSKEVVSGSVSPGETPSSGVVGRGSPVSGSRGEKTISPDSVVIGFVKKSLGENFADQMGEGWMEKVLVSFRNWKPEEVNEFLGEMESRIGREATVRRLGSLSYFSLSGYRSFREKVSFFERYMGEGAVTGRLGRSMGGFFTPTSLGTLERIAGLLEPYMGSEVLGRAMEKSPEKFSRINLGELRKILNHAEPRVGREVLGEMMGNDFFGFLESFSYRYKSAGETLDALVKLEERWGQTQRDINEAFFNNDLSGKEFDNFYGRFESGRNRIQRRIGSLVDKMSDDVNGVRAFEVNTADLMVSVFFRTFMEDITALRVAKESHEMKEERTGESTESGKKSLFEVTDPHQLFSERSYPFTTVDGRSYFAVFSEGYLSELVRISRESPEYFSKMLQKLHYGVHGGSSREAGVIILNNHGIFEVRTVGGKNNGFRPYGYIKGNVLHFLRLNRENGHSSRTIVRERGIIRQMMLQRENSLH